MTKKSNDLWFVNKKLSEAKTKLNQQMKLPKGMLTTVNALKYEIEHLNNCKNHVNSRQ